MLKQETINKLAELAKVTPDQLSAAIKAETETDLTIPSGLIVLSEDERQTLANNEYKKGRQDGVEIKVKEVKEKLGLDFTGKSIDALLEAHKAKVEADAKIEPNQQVKDLQEKLQSVQNNYQALEQKLSEKDGEVQKVKVSTELIKNLPQGVTVGEKLIRLMELDGYSFKLIDKGLVAAKDGKELNDHLSNPMKVTDVLQSYAKENNLLAATPAGGRGAGDAGGGAAVFTKLSEIKEHFTRQGKSTLGTDFAAAVAEAAKVDGFKMDA